MTLHSRLMRAARKLVKECTEVLQSQGKCFLLGEYLKALERNVSHILENHPFEEKLGAFELNSHSIARYLFVLVCLEEGENPAGETFRGLPVVD